MIDIDELIEEILKINANCKRIDMVKNQSSASFCKEKETIDKETNSLIKSMESKLALYKEQHFYSLRNKILDVINILCNDYNIEWIDSSPTINVKGKSYGEIKEQLNGVIKQINDYFSKLNLVNFEELVPPEHLSEPSENEETDGFTVYGGAGDNTHYTVNSVPIISIKNTKPIKEIVKEFFPICRNALLCIDTLVSLFEADFAIDKYKSSLKSSATAWMAEKKSKFDTEYNKTFEELFTSDSANREYNDFFEKLAEDGQTAEVDVEAGSLDYKETINLGNVDLLVEDDKHYINYLNESPSLNRWLNGNKSKYITAPVILDLKKCGNILLTVDEESYEDDTIRFINQIIMRFLMSFPASRIKFNLIDIGNKVGLSHFKTLTKIDTGILLNGIIRDDRKLDDAIKDMEQMMYSIEDDKLSFNGVKDIFEYNSKFEATPQNVYLFVLIDSPNGLKSDTAKRLTKLLQNGNKCGIFSLIVQNKHSRLDSLFRVEDYKAYITALLENSLLIDKVDSKFRLSLESEQKRYSSTKSLSTVRDESNQYCCDIDIDFKNKNATCFYPTNIPNVEMLPKIVETLCNNAEENKQTAIHIKDMFDYSNKLDKNAKKLYPPEHTLEIPIGLSGGETQTLKLMTSGGSAHAVVIGGTGSGKSNLLHTIILNACYRYSPQDLNFYLVDFKGGVEFKFYEANMDKSKQLPHIKLTSLTSDLNDGVSVLLNLEKELRNREDLFRDNGVEDIIQYKKLGKKIPRLVVLIDEIQELFERDETLGQKAINILSELVKKGRAFGINILWASQNVPRVPGLKNKVLSQIGNKISLRLNNPEDALDLDLDLNAVKGLNRPEKGLGVINDERYGNESREFRVAYAENSETRKEFVADIISKWKPVTEKIKQEPLIVVGNDSMPSPIEGDTYFASVPSKKDIVSKAFASYKVEVGQDYITGKPLQIELEKEDKENMLIIGNDIEITRDIMGYSLLSIVANSITDSDFINEAGTIFYANGEMLTPNNSTDLFNVLKNDFSNIIDNVSSTEKFIRAIADLYNLYKMRNEEAESGEELKVFAPYYMVIHNMQRFVDAFNSNRPLPDEEGYTLGSNFSQSKQKGIADAFKDLYLKGGKLGIHFIISVDNPNSFTAFKRELLDCNYIVVTKGVSRDFGTSIFGDVKAMNGLSNSKVALIQSKDERIKVKIYRYENEADAEWYAKLCSEYKKLG